MVLDTSKIPYRCTQFLKCLIHGLELLLGAMAFRILGKENFTFNSLIPAFRNGMESQFVGSKKGIEQYYLPSGC